jgi:hypothetical protein
MWPDRQDVGEYLLPLSIPPAARGARYPALVHGGTARSRQHAAEVLHNLGRTREGALVLLAEHLGMAQVLLSLLRHGVASLSSVTLYFDRADTLGAETRKLVLAVLHRAQDHWLEDPGRRDGVRIIGGTQFEERLHPDLAAALGALRVDAGAAGVAKRLAGALPRRVVPSALGCIATSMVD